MKAALVSDVHGNHEALKAVIADIRSRGLETVYSLGDVVGYGPEPQACLDLLRKEAEVHLMGNHDAAVVEMTSVATFNDNARRAVEWARTVMDKEGMDFLRRRPYVARREDLLLVHASPEEPSAWHYIMSISTARRGFEHISEEVCFVGHTHVPFIVAKREDGQVEEVAGTEVTYGDSSSYIVNVGSVGQPRDLDPRASYGIVDTEARTVEICRVPYDIERTQRLMRAVDLPPFLIERLAVGR